MAQLILWIEELDFTIFSPPWPTHIVNWSVHLTLPFRFYWIISVNSVSLLGPVQRIFFHAFMPMSHIGNIRGETVLTQMARVELNASCFFPLLFFRTTTMEHLQISVVIWDMRPDGPDGPPPPLDVRTYRYPMSAAQKVAQPIKITDISYHNPGKWTANRHPDSLATYPHLQSALIWCTQGKLFRAKDVRELKLWIFRDTRTSA